MDNCIGQRIKQEREDRGWTQQYLAKELLLPDSSYISKIEKGIRKISAEELISLSDLFDCTIEYLIGKTDIRNNKSEKPNSIPIIGTINVGIPIVVNENIEGYLEVPNYFHGDYVLRVKGDSMIGVGILDGDLAICRETTVPQNGQIIVALRDEGTNSEATLKFYINDESPFLRAANPAFVDIDYQDRYQTGGVMVALVREEAPGYQVYKDYISVLGYDEWIEVIEFATSTGIKPERMKSFIKMINELGKGE